MLGDVSFPTAFLLYCLDRKACLKLFVKVLKGGQRQETFTDPKAFRGFRISWAMCANAETFDRIRGQLQWPPQKEWIPFSKPI